MAFGLVSERYIKQLERERIALYKALERAVKAIADTDKAHPAAVNGRKVLESIDIDP
jgi:hypothetical protein